MSQAACFHCTEPVAETAKFPVNYREQTHPCCCAGCQAIAQTIIDSGLGRYYDDRTDAATQANPLPAEVLEQIRLYDDEAMQRNFVDQSGEASREAHLLLEGITCAACIWLNEQHIGRLQGVQLVSINYTTHRARIRWNPAQIKLSEILEAIAAIGYRATPYDHARAEAAWQKRHKQAQFRLWTAGLSMMQVMMFAVPVYLAEPGDIAPQWLLMMNWASMLLTLPVVLYSSWPFYQSAWRDLKARRAGMDLPVTVGVLAAFIASLPPLLSGRGEVYFDSVTMFVFLLLGGRYLEMRARQRAGAATERLVKLIPAFTHRLSETADGQRLEEYPVSQLRPGDRVVCRPGEIIPADGVIIEGQTEVNEALLTGESTPICKAVDDEVTGGASNLLSPITIRVSEVGDHTRLAAIVRLLDRAMQHKPRLAQLADRISGWFVLILLLVAAATWWFWHLHDPIHALPITVAVLVISCPCALSLATPAALVAATGHLATHGILSHRPDSLEDTAQITDIVFDKTGTLTLGQPALQEQIMLHGSPHHARELAAALEATSSHPLAKALQQEGCTPAQDITYLPGGGLTGLIDGEPYWIGHPDFIRANCPAPEPAPLPYGGTGTVVVLASATHWLALFILQDQLRENAAAAISRLQQLGLNVHLLSGDNRQTVEHVAGLLGISKHRAAASPEQKLDYVQKLQQSGRRVLMLGDGVNDAPVLAAAEVSMAMGSGVDISHAAGDMVLLNNQLTGVVTLLALARKTRSIIRQNLAWALLYNAAAIPLAACGYVTPWIASAGMAASSLLVVMNALRLTRARTGMQK
ncbi:heavy metal translocating P-type ATPase [Chitinilyticum piscinae]|uniref:Heavy metal translocating P-type ATPase n=1 Tax=Chitinilyticum piscinae TaxID=2866724 RepID=A0A8J7FRR5_9NEIS|nr:heavy metal translocating P-type ATPase [Chitinilyticum piscinae]MBE9609696.1 heavy metal translocating P-type ATPase [Chitinilyticum piscinae]